MAHKQASLLAQEHVAKSSAVHGYTKNKLSPGLWSHQMRPIHFSLLLMTLGQSMSEKNMQIT